MRIHEITVMDDGTGHYSKTPFECRNIQAAAVSGEYIRLKPLHKGRFLDNTKLIDSDKEDWTRLAAYRDPQLRILTGRLNDLVFATPENAADRLAELYTLPNLRDTGQLESWTGLSMVIRYDTQRLNRDRFVPDGHYLYFGGQSVVWAPDHERLVTRSSIYMQMDYDVVNNVTGETVHVSTGQVEKEVTVIKGFW